MVGVATPDSSSFKDKLEDHPVHRKQALHHNSKNKTDFFAKSQAEHKNRISPGDTSN